MTPRLAPRRAPAADRGNAGTLQRRVLGVVSGLGVALLLAVLAKGQADSRQLDALLEKARDDRARTFQQIVDLRSASLRSFVADYSPWDDMVEFVQRPGFTWGSENLDSAPSSFDVSSIWVFDRTHELVYGTRTSDDDEVVHVGGRAQVGHVDADEHAGDGATTRDVLGLSHADSATCLGHRPLDRERIEKLLAGPGRVWHWFEATPCGPLEISGATIVATVDLERKGPTHGTFFATRLWNDSELALLGRAAGVSLDAHAGFRPDAAFIDAADGTLAFEIPLPGIDGKPIAGVTGSLRAAPIAAFRMLLVGSFALLAGVVALLILSLAFTLNRFVVRPVDALSRAIEEETLEPVGSLLDDRSELGGLARALRQRFAERGTLAEERAGRRAADEALAASKIEHETERRARAALLARVLGDASRRASDIASQTSALVGGARAARPADVMRSIRQNTEAIVRTVEDVIALAEHDANESEAARSSELDPRTWLEESLDVLAVGAHARGIELAGCVSADVPERVLCDAIRVQRLLARIVGRALREAHAGAEIIVQLNAEACAGEERTLELVVRELAGSTARATPLEADASIELALCEQEVRPLGGSVSLEHERGGDRTIRVRIPCRAPHGSLLVSETVRALAGRHVLVLDPSSGARRGVTSTLIALGARAVEVTSVERAVERLRLAQGGAPAFDAMVVDAASWRAGWKVLGEALAANRAPAAWPIVVVRALAERDEGPDDPDRPDPPVVKKPVHRAVLAARLLEVMQDPA